MQKFIFVVLLVVLFVVAVSAKHHNKNQVEYAEPYLNMSTADHVQGCNCLRSGFALFGYEQSVSSNAGSGCIGGCGGSDYVFHEQGSLVQHIYVWLGCGTPNNGITGVQITLKNGHAKTVGRPCGNPYTFTFGAGELLVGNVVLCGNGIGTRLGHISFATNKNRRFSVGNLNTPYNFPADGRALSGIFGGAGVDVDRLGFIFTKPVRSAVVNNVRYPTLSSITSGLTPSLLTQDTVCNNGANGLPKTVSYSETTGTDYCWTTQTSLGLEVSFSVSAGIPEVQQVSAGYKWTVGVTNTFNRCVHSTKSSNVSTTVTTPPRNSCTWVITQFKSALANIPFTANLALTFTDGSSYTMPTSGAYSGVYITKSTTNRNCRTVTTCPKSDVDDDDDDDDSTTDDDDDDDTAATASENDFVNFELPQNGLNVEAQ